MNWLAFLLTAWLCFGLELGLKDAVRLGPVAPSFVIPLATFVALSAPSRQGVWASLLLGVLMDLTWTAPRADLANATIIGPYAVGLLVAGNMVHSMRGFVIRRNVLTVVLLSMLAAAVCHIVVTAFMTARMLYGDPIVWSPTAELLQRLLGAAYTGITAALLAIALRPIEPVFGFPVARGGRRS